MQTESNQLLPPDLVLEIIARSSTAATIIRCAATSKPLRRAILQLAFLHRLRGVIPRDDDGGHHRFVPSLLSLFHQTRDPRYLLAFVPAMADVSIAASLPLVPPTPPNCDTDEKACVFGSYLPMASHHSLLVLRWRSKDMWLALAPSTDGTSQASLSVLVLEGDRIAVWVRRTSARGKGSWAQRHVMHQENIARPMDFPQG